MNIGTIAAKVGTSLLKNAIPGVGFILDIVNEFLPDGKKLPDTATGNDLIKAVNSLPPEQQMQLMAKEFDVEIAEIEGHVKVMEALAQADATGSSTRPKIALIMAYATCFAIISFISFVDIAIFNKDWETIEKLAGCWELIAVVLGIPSAVLTSYFGKRTKEKEARYALTNGGKKSNVIVDVISAFKK